MLECGDGTLYTGITDDFLRRFKAHAEGRGAKYTRGRGPLIVRYLEQAADKSAALKRECAVKRLRKREKWTIILDKQMETKSLLAFLENQSYTKDSKDKTECLTEEE